jgi:hypothetical protein
MPTNAYKVLGQSNPAANTNADPYTVPAGKSAVVSTIAVCNQGGSLTTFRVAVRPGGAAIAAQHYVAYDAPVDGNDSVYLTLGITLAAGDVVTVRAGTANVAFNVFGNEITP